VEGRYDQLGLSDWSYEQPLQVVADPGEDEVDRLLAELFPRTNGGVQNHFYSDPNMPPVSQMPELHAEAEAVLDILDGADLPVRVASALQERRARREEEAQENARLEAEEARRSEARKRLEEAVERESEALRTAKARRKVEAEEARKAAQAERQQRAMKAEEARKAAQAERQQRAMKAEEARKAAQAERQQRARQAEEARKAAQAERQQRARQAEEARKAAQAERQHARQAEEARKAAQAEQQRARQAEEARKAAQAERQQRADEVVRAAAEADRERIANEEAGRKNQRRLAAEASRRTQAKAWSAPVVVLTQAHPPEVPPPTSVVAAAAAEPVSRSGDGGPRNRTDNVVQFPGRKRSSPGPGALQPGTDAAQPKRRGRPPGSKNRVRPPASHSATATPEARPPTTPVLRTTDAVSLAPALRPLRRLSSSAYPLLTASFPLPSWRSINALRDSWSRSLPYDTDVLKQARAALPSDCIRWRIRSGEVSFSEVVASVMTAGGQGVRLLLFHDVHLGVAAIDVRCLRPQLVERWSRCIAAAKASLPAGCEMPSHGVMDQVERLRVDLTVSTLVECLWGIGLGVAVGPVEA